MVRVFCQKFYKLGVTEEDCEEDGSGEGDYIISRGVCRFVTCVGGCVGHSGICGEICGWKVKKG